MKYHAKKVMAWHIPAWHKWPDMQDTDYTEILERRWVERVRIGKDIIDLENRYYPVFAAQASTGNLSLPVVYPGIDNTKQLPQSVKAAQIKLLRKVCQGADYIMWDHGRQCYPWLARLLPKLAAVRLLFNADDCELSSPIRTFPVCKHFNAYMHWMDVYDPTTGQRVREVYAQHGLRNTYHGGSGCTSGLQHTLNSMSLDPQDKADRIEQGLQPDIDLVYLGANNVPGDRRIFLDEIIAQRTSIANLNYRLHGEGMPDGFFEDTTEPGKTRIADLYWMSLAGINIAHSSLFNMRLWDLWMCGVVQILHDRWGELERAGFYPGVHYLEAETPEQIPELLRFLKRDSKTTATIIRAAHKRATEYLASHCAQGTMHRIYAQQLLPHLKSKEDA